MGIEPTLSAWKAEVLPLNYTRRISMVEGEGFEPSKPKQQIYSLPPLTTREPLQSASTYFFRIRVISQGSMFLYPSYTGKAGGRLRTNDLLITSQLLYQLSYASTA